MSPPAAFSYDHLLQYTDIETRRWRAWFQAHPGALNAPFAEGGERTVGDLVIHIFAAEQRYAERLSEREVTSYDDIHADGLDEIFALGERARAMLREYLATMTDADGAVVLSFPTLTAGTLTATKHKIASNLFLHGIRHWAQIASAVRAANFGDSWGHDFLLASVEA